ncbi:S41 family peptidase [Pedobacter mendelii]|uniref:Tail specific protease domain-containing protein n=1 Tax=Pedobacter mendelii TaxID=1908240 RepID=A0ABQ2BD07_9SPHI|nr:S41 family peptidase [Pedobacter mendelii]GGI23079.1 hypothetical protein GCM10008119_05870 [Pedobacter mendelii]
MMKRSILSALISLTLFSSCKESDSQFGQKLVNVFKTKSINKRKIDWDMFEREVLKSAIISKDSAIITSLTLNNNPHTFFLKGKKILKGNYALNIPIDTCHLFGNLNKNLLENIGYVRVDGFNTNTSESYRKDTLSSNYINDIVNSIRKQDRDNLRGWIIDLRYNSGGDMWPMLVATTPFLLPSILGSFKEENRNLTWRLDNNEIWLGDNSQNIRLGVGKIKYKIINKNAKIAVLINHRTKSAGEAIVLALKSLNNVKLFGLQTHGFATSNETIYFGNKEVLVLTTGFMADLKGQTYPNGISPDVSTCSMKMLNYELNKWLLE